MSEYELEHSHYLLLLTMKSPQPYILTSFLLITSVARHRKYQSQNVEAAADAWGLKVCVGYNSDGNSLQCKLFFCGNGATLAVASTSPDGNVQATGCELKSDHTIDMSRDNAAGWMSTINWATDVTQNFVGRKTRSLRGNNQGEVLTAEEATTTTFMNYAAPLEELGRDIEDGDELN